MSDFASAAMVRILSAGMRLEGLAPPAPPVAQAHVALDAKRALVGAAVAQVGWAVLPRLGRGITTLRGDPVHQALATGRGPLQLVERWCRLERYIHSRHRITWAAASPLALTIAHTSLHAGQPPLPHEDLVVLGVLAAALEEDGARGVRASIRGVPAYPQPDAAGLSALADAGQTGRWDLAWDHGPADGPAPAPAPAAPAQGPALAQAVTGMLLADLMQPLSVDALAQRLAMAPRSLQRALAGHGLTYSGLVAQARCHAAASHLVQAAHGIAEIGFLCGFSDQAHFTRVFSRCVGLPPARYRKDFTRAARGSSCAPT
jgi:AraC-like DNA-binding protein